jgi:hypothetical protein
MDDDVLFQVLAGYWHDRPESDDEIIDELVLELTPEERAAFVEAARALLESDVPDSEKAERVRRAAFRWLPTDDEAIAFLRHVVERVEEPSP